MNIFKYTKGLFYLTCLYENNKVRQLKYKFLLIKLPQNIELTKKMMTQKYGPMIPIGYSIVHTIDARQDIILKNNRFHSGDLKTDIPVKPST